MTKPKRTRLRASAKNAVKLSQPNRCAIEDAIGHSFEAHHLIERAFTHGSLTNRQPKLHSYQRLEFLGDRVLNLIIAEHVFLRRPDEREGSLAPRLNAWVNKSACAEAMRHLDLGQYILMSSHEVDAGGREKMTILGDCCEALLGAIYLDGGLGAAREFVRRAWEPQFKDLGSTEDPIMALQELSQARGAGLPVYTETARTGPAHAPMFTICVDIDKLTAIGTGQTKQEARRTAAIAWFAQNPSEDIE